MQTAQPGASVKGRDATVTVGQLLTLGVLEVDEVLGGDGAALRRVEVVVPGTSVRAIASLPPGALAVFDRTQLAAEDVAIDLAIRTGYRAQIAGIIAERPQRPIPVATRRLAEKFSVPVLLLAHVEVGGIVALLEQYVRTPASVGSELLGATVTALSTVPRRADELLQRLAAAVRFPVGLIDTEGHVVAGDLEPLAGSALAEFQECGTGSAAPTARLIRGDREETVLVQSATVSDGAVRNLWLVSRLPARTSGYILDACARSLAIAALAFTAYLAERSLEFERESRQRTLLLTEILEQPESPRRRTVERATALGWRLSGWHTAAHITSRAAAATGRPGGTAALIEEALRTQHLAATLVERPTGWAFWTTVETEPSPRETAELARTVRRALVAVERDQAQLRLCAGIGGAHPGTTGIGRSMQEAEQASLLARTHETAAPVEHIDTTSVKRLLVGWYSSGPLGDIVAALLEPLRGADPTGELVHTLGVYLDHESSATTTAAVLGVHRNTIINRLDKIQRLLPVDLSQADQRLAVHLAVHAAATSS